MKTKFICFISFILTIWLFAQDRPFITVWDLSKTGATGNNSISFTILSSGTGPIEYTWISDGGTPNSGQGSWSSSTTTATITNLPANQNVTLSIAPNNLREFTINSSADKSRLLDVKQWGSTPWTNMTSMFSGAVNMTMSATDAPDLSSVTRMDNMFFSAKKFNQNISHWNTSNVTNMSSMFNDASTFNQDISQWNTSNVTTMVLMFYDARAFNQDLSNLKLRNNVQLNYMLDDSGMSCENYSKTLLAWSQRADLPTGRTLGATNLKYGTNTLAARDILTKPTSEGGKGWTITGDSSSGTVCDNFSFISEWDLSKTGATGNNSISFNIANTGPVSYTWTSNGGTPSSGSGTIVNGATSATISGLPANQKITLSIEPFNLKRFYINNNTDKARLTDVKQWGSAEWTSMANMFDRASNMTMTATDSPNLTHVTSMTSMFRSVLSFNSDITKWNTSNVTDMSFLFYNATAFNQDISQWDTSNVKDMNGILQSASSFNQDLSNLKLNSDNILNYMLENSGMSCLNYSKTLIAWSRRTYLPTGVRLGAGNLKYGTNAISAREILTKPVAQGGKGWTIPADIPSGTVCDNYSFITEWDLSKNGTSGNNSINFSIANSGPVSYTWTSSGATPSSGSGTFAEGLANATITGLPANQKITLSIEPFNLKRFYINNGTNRSRLTDVKQWGSAEWTSMQGMFHGANNVTMTATDTPNTSSVEDMSAMFNRASIFNGNISQWDTSNVILMNGMFEAATAFNQDISQWNTSKVQNMYQMFSNAYAFNQDISRWDTSKVTDMGGMFYEANVFNQDISQWNTSNVFHMDYMFSYTKAFNQDISLWDTSKVIDMSHMFERAIAFNQDLSNLKFYSYVNLANMLHNSAMSCENYSKTLIAWSKRADLPSGMPLGAINIKYGTNAVAARNILTTSKGWNIHGDSPSGTVCDNFSFITEWDLSKNGTSGNNSISFIIANTGPVNYTWTSNSGTPSSGSGTFANGLTEASITGLPANQKITLSIEPFNLKRFHIWLSDDKKRLTDIKQWGSTNWSTMTFMFYGATNMTMSATDKPNTSSMDNMEFMLVTLEVSHAEISWLKAGAS